MIRRGSAASEVRRCGAVPPSRRPEKKKSDLWQVKAGEVKKNSLYRSKGMTAARNEKVDGARNEPRGPRVTAGSQNICILSVAS